jgi:peptidoglycan/xylan/chitin deacetylase (PgdA/CDA1 family)
MRGMNVPPNSFKLQMWLLKKLCFRGLSIRQLKPYLEGKRFGKVAGITFDDGYQNNLVPLPPDNIIGVIIY